MLYVTWDGVLRGWGFCDVGWCLREGVCYVMWDGILRSWGFCDMGCVLERVCVM